MRTPKNTISHTRHCVPNLIRDLPQSFENDVSSKGMLKMLNLIQYQHDGGIFRSSFINKKGVSTGNAFWLV